MGHRRDPSSRAITAANRALQGSVGSTMPVAVSASSGRVENVLEKVLRNILLTFAAGRSTVIKGSGRREERGSKKEVRYDTV